MRGQSDPSSRDRLRSARICRQSGSAHNNLFLCLRSGCAALYRHTSDTAIRSGHGRHIFAKCRAFSGNVLQPPPKPSDPELQRLPGRSKESLPLFGRELVRQHNGRELGSVQDLVGISVADAAQQTRISQRPLQRMIFRREHGAERIEIRGEHINSAGVQGEQSLFPADQMQRRPALASRLGQDQGALGKSKAARLCRPASFASRARQCNRPAIIRCSTSQRSLPKPKAMRLPIRRSSPQRGLQRTPAEAARSAAGTGSPDESAPAVDRRCAVRAR